MAARLHYYRVYFEKQDTQERATQEKLAEEWMIRALMRDPTNPDLQIKLADVYALQTRYDETVVIMERLEKNDDAPQYTQQWLGYYLLFIDGREDDSIRHSMAYLNRFPSSESAVYNAACAYAQKYAIELDNARMKESLDSANRIESLHLLRQAIRMDSTSKVSAKKDSDDDGSFKSLRSDREFIELIADSVPQ